MNLITLLGSSFHLDGWSYPRTIIRMHCSKQQPTKELMEMTWRMAKVYL